MLFEKAGQPLRSAELPVPQAGAAQHVDRRCAVELGAAGDAGAGNDDLAARCCVLVARGRIGLRRRGSGVLGESGMAGRQRGHRNGDRQRGTVQPHDYYPL